jgi:hypothetical protein
VWRHNLLEGALECFFTLVNAKLSSGFHKPLELTLVTYL